MSTHNALIATLAIGLLAIPSTAGAGANPDFTVPLHAKEGIGWFCDDYLPVDCITHRPTVNIAPGVSTIYIFVSNYTGVAALETCFEWDPVWDLLGSFINCQGHPINLGIPSNPGGPYAGTLSTAFDCVTGPTIAVIGFMVFTVGPQGCLAQINSLRAPTHRVTVVDCQLEVDFLDADDPQQQLRLGKICVGSGGHDACDPLATPAEAATWGKVKATYR